jgi:hypothetical protein
VTGRKEPPRHWHFWRSGFWTRPALILMYSVLAGLVGLFFLTTVPENLADARAMLDAPECSRSDQARCLEPLPAEVDGPFSQRGPGSEWHFYSTDNERRLLGDADISTYGSSKLDDGDRVEVLMWEGEIVVVFSERGERIETDAFGHGGWIVPLGLGLFAVSGAMVGIQMARIKRMGARNWWSTSSETAGALLPPSLLNVITGVVMFGGASAALGIAFGLKGAPAAILGIAVMMGLAALVAWGARRKRDRS